MSTCPDAGEDAVERFGQRLRTARGCKIGKDLLVEAALGREFTAQHVEIRCLRPGGGIGEAGKQRRKVALRLVVGHPLRFQPAAADLENAEEGSHHGAG